MSGKIEQTRGIPNVFWCIPWRESWSSMDDWDDGTIRSLSFEKPGKEDKDDV
jgi:hypothetical protein